MVVSPIQNYPKVEIDFSPQVPPLKKVRDKTKIDIRYSLVSPFAYVHIYWDQKEFELKYEIEEPILTEQEQLYRNQIILAMRNMINFESMKGEGEEALLDYLDKRFKLH